MTRIAYCLSVFKNPEQVSRLMERIYSPSDYFYVHGDKKISQLRWESIFGRYRDGNLVFTSRGKIVWGAFGFVKVMLDGMRYFSRFDYDYFIDLSGQCYPIKSLSVIKRELGKKSSAYMEYFRLPSENWKGENGGFDRIHYVHIRSLKRRWIRFPRLRKTLPDNVEPYGGSAWFCLPKRFVDYILKYVSDHPQIIRFYKYCKIPDEMFFNTIIMNSPLKFDVVNDNKRYVCWGAPPARSPEILREKDLEQIMHSDELFARKFDITIDKNILDLIDKKTHRNQTSFTGASVGDSIPDLQVINP